MTACRPPLALLVASLGACADLSVYGPPVGVGLTAIVKVQRYECDEAIVNETCGDSKVRASEARSLDPDVMAIVGIEHGHVRVHGKAAGAATIEIDAGGQTVSDVIEIQDIEYQSLIGCWPADYGWPCKPALYFTGSEIDVSDGMFFRRGDDGSWDLLSGTPELWVEPGQTNATLDQDLSTTAHDYTMLAGQRPGIATLHSNTGGKDEIEIVGIDRIATLEPRYRALDPDDDLIVTEIALAPNGSPILDLHPRLADGRKIRGESPDPPTAVSDSPQVTVDVPGHRPNAIRITRIGVGDATVTIRWGGATATIKVTDPRTSGA